MQERLSKFRVQLDAAGHSAALIHRPENMFYISGYRGEGMLLITGSQAAVLTDFRYVEQAGSQAPGWAIEMTTADNPPEAIAKSLLDGEGIVSVALEHDFLPMADYEKLAGKLGITLSPLNGIPENLRRIKEPGELIAMRKASSIACAAFDKVLPFIKPGVSEKDIKLELEYTMLRLGADAVGFPSIVAAGPNGSLPHATPGPRKLQAGELLTMDFGAESDGYLTDITRTVAVGKISDELRRIYDDVLSAQLMALDAVKSGAVCKTVDAVARDYLEARYPGRFGHGLGHGVGVMIHESPRFNARDDTVLEAGMVMTVEPGVYIPGLGGCRIEDTVAVTQEGCEILITAPKHLIEL